MPSDFLKLNWEDFGRGLIVAVLVAVLTVIQKSLTECGLSCIDWLLVGNVAISSMIAYLLKNLFTNSDGQILQGEK